MMVHIKDLSIVMEIKNKGVEFGVYAPDGVRHLGDLIVARSGLTLVQGPDRSQEWQKNVVGPIYRKNGT